MSGVGSRDVLQRRGVKIKQPASLVVSTGCAQIASVREKQGVRWRRTVDELKCNGITTTKY